MNLDCWAESIAFAVACLYPRYFDDIIQEARIAYWRAQRDYEPARSGAYEVFVKKRMRQYLFRALKKYKRWSHETPTGWLEG